MQNYPESMDQHQTNKLYSQWNLEATSRILAKRFPESLVIVVKPKEMLLNTFSIYSNFVEFDQDGLPAPFIESSCGALDHLSKLYAKAWEEYSKSKTDTCDSKDDSEFCKDSTKSSQITSFQNIPISLVGFSKGCVPLNHLMFELLTRPTIPETFTTNIKSVYWLDSGHNARKDLWITNDKVLQLLAASPYELFVHVSPYQVKDPNRPWIGKEYKQFLRILRSYKANIKETKHHFEEQGSLELHFEILKEF